jgi:hypothetical protein
MGSMFFGQYLLSKGAINHEALIDAIERQRKTNLSLVELSVFHLKHFTSGPVKLQTLTDDEGALSSGRRRFAQKLVGGQEVDVRVFA